MNIELRRFILEPMNSKNEEHSYALNRLASNEKIRKYISLDFGDFVKDADATKKFDFGSGYVVKKSDEILGFCGTTEKDRNGIVEFWLALNPGDSNKGNGTKILVEVTSYLIDTFRDLKDIRLVIRKDNYISKQSALNGGYHLTDVDEANNTETYSYFG